MRQNTIKVLFVIPTLMAGGAERIMTFLSKNLDNTIFDSTLIVIGSRQEVSYDITGVKIKFLNKSRVLLSIPSLILCIHNEKPQIVMGSVMHLNSFIGLIGILFPKTIFVGRQAAISKISLQYNTNNNKNYFLGFMIKSGLRKLDYIICQSNDMLKDCKDTFQIKDNKLKIINNPITDNFPVKNNDEPHNTDVLKFITVGRLTRIKGFIRLLKVLSNLKFPFTYTIIGAGPEKENIVNKINALHLTQNVRFIDFTKDVSQYLAQSNFYLQGSFAEGFPNALLESCAVGTPAIAFSAPGGTSEIIENGINGFIVKNEEEFLWRLNNLKIFDPKKVSESVYKKFAKEIILKEYESFFQKIIDEQ